MRLIEITLLNIKKIGFFRTFYKILKYPYSKLKNNRLKDVDDNKLKNVSAAWNIQFN